MALIRKVDLAISPKRYLLHPIKVTSASSMNRLSGSAAGRAVVVSAKAAEEALVPTLERLLLTSNPKLDGVLDEYETVKIDVYRPPSEGIWLGVKASVRLGDGGAFVFGALTINPVWTPFKASEAYKFRKFPSYAEFRRRLDALTHRPR